MTIGTIIRSMRPPFLLLTLSCCALAFSAAAASGQMQDPVLMLPILLLALFAHISVNILNEYLDFSSGLDLSTIRTPFSGGSGALPEDPESSSAVMQVALFSLIITAGLGLYLSLRLGLHLLVPGLLGIAIIIAYTRWINRLPWLCLIAPGLGFGPLMVGVSYVALSEPMDLPVFLLTLIPFFLVNNLLLLNQYPDIEADRAAGRNHIPIRYGITVSNLIFLAFLLAAFSLVVALVVLRFLPWLSLIALLPLLPGLYAYLGAIRYGHEIGQQPKFMAANVVTALLTPFLIALSLLVDLA